MSRLHQLAEKLSNERVPPTCTALHTAGVAAVAKFTHWCSKETRWFGRLSRMERHRLEVQIGEFCSDILEGAKEHGTRVLREAHIREIEDHLRMNLTPERITAVEAGEDLNVAELFPSEPADTQARP
jgi:hypothetical protein